MVLGLGICQNASLRLKGTILKHTESLSLSFSLLSSLFPPSISLSVPQDLFLSPSISLSLNFSLISLTPNPTHIHIHTCRKALAVAGFPSEAIISEYLTSKNRLPCKDREVLSWRFPRVLSAQAVCHRLLEWPFEYTQKKMLSLVTQWCLRKEGVVKGAELHGHVTPQRFVCTSYVIVLYVYSV